MPLRLVLCLLLTCASLPLMAREVRALDANGDGGSCPESGAQADDTSTSAGKRPAHTVRPAARTRAATSRGGDNAGEVRPPRWHSFLPGMFR